jgi:osmotically-inducible protein OsmY
MTTVTEIEADVRAEIALDPRIPNVDEIAVSSQDGGVILRGTVVSSHH